MRCLGRDCCWHFCNLLHQSYCDIAGAAAERAALKKHAKYEHFKNNYIFIPLACEVMGAWSADSIAFFDGLAEKIHSITGDKREREREREREKEREREINNIVPETFYCDPKRKCCLHSMLFFWWLFWCWRYCLMFVNVFLRNKNYFIIKKNKIIIIIIINNNNNNNNK